MYSRILVPVDLDEPSSWEKAAPTALAMAGCFGAKVELIHVLSDIDLAVQAEWSGLAVRRMLATARSRLDLLAMDLDEKAGIETHVAMGRVYRAILDLAEQRGIDLIVMASHRPEMKDYLIGTNSERVVRHAGCSVMVVRD